MDNTVQKLVLTVPTSKMVALLEVLDQFDFVEIESLQEIINRFVKNAPKKIKVSDDDIADILMKIRYNKSLDIDE